MSLYYTATGFLHNHNLAYISGETSLYCKISFGRLIYSLFQDKKKTKLSFGTIQKNSTERF